MAEFFTRLFESIFTPGPTPTLVIATNASFAALQLLLLSLAAVTWNVHFMILSVLSAGLWWAINWFVRELELAKASEDGQGPRQGHGQGHTGLHSKKDAKHAEDSGTETEDAATTGLVVDEARLKENMRLRVQNETHGRRSSVSDVSGTDSEWDKVEVEEEEGLGKA